MSDRDRRTTGHYVTYSRSQNCRWGDWWNTYLPRHWNNRRAIDTCPDNVGEEQELRYYRYRLGSIYKWIQETNAALGSSVQIGAVLLDAETYRIDWSNETEVRALERKHDLMYNVSRLFCDPSLDCTIEQYNRGTVFSTFTLAKPDEGVPANDHWAQWPGYPKCRGLGDTFGTSLYSECRNGWLGPLTVAATLTQPSLRTGIPEYETTRESYRLTVQNAKSCNVSWVTPWLWLGGGGRRMVDATHDGSMHYDYMWDYDIAYSWMLGKELNVSCSPFGNAVSCFDGQC